MLKIFYRDHLNFQWWRVHHSSRLQGHQHLRTFGLFRHHFPRRPGHDQRDQSLIPDHQLIRSFRILLISTPLTYFLSAIIVIFLNRSLLTLITLINFIWNPIYWTQFDKDKKYNKIQREKSTRTKFLNPSTDCLKPSTAFVRFRGANPKELFLLL